MSIQGSERQEKIIRAWSQALAGYVHHLDIQQAENYVRRSLTEAELATEQKLNEMDHRDLSDPGKAQFVGKVVSLLYNHISQEFKVENAEALRKLLIDVYQQFPDHS